MKQLFTLILLLCLFNQFLTAQTGCEVRGLGGNWDSGPVMTGTPPTVTTNVASRSEYKIYCSSNNTWYPSGDNPWTNGGGNVTFMLDVSGRALASEQVMNFSLCAPGAFSGWNNASGMTQNGNQWCFVVPSPGTYEWKPTKCSSWDSWNFWNGERNINSANWSVTTNTPNQTVCVNYMPSTGALGNAFLPVTWLDFKVTKNNSTNFLHWRTASEVNNEYFEILFSSDGHEFERIGKITGAGTKHSESSYSYQHDNEKPGLSFYKIRQVDFDGKASYSDIRFTRNKSESIYIYPIAGAGMFYLAGLVSGDVHLQISDQNGKVLFRQTNFTDTFFDISNYVSGIYFVSIQNKTDTQQFKIIKM